ncbi:MAG: methyl-accepting chemotaxis protein [Spirochaetaceae bacterium]|jgi:methyl-accepting chemotaxis protein|nr:methyl-accepting chemotaxis protein [Spirochaetaceae bacterium]
MKTLKTQFFFIFIGLSVFVALAVGLSMYLQYHNYIRYTYQDTLKRVATMIEKKYPILTDTDRLEKEAQSQSDTIWALCRDFKAVADAFDMEFVYYVRKVNDQYQYLVDSSASPENQSDLLAFYSGKAVGVEADRAYQTQTMQITSSLSEVEQWSNLIAGYLPIVKNGVTVGIVGADYNISFVKTLEQQAGMALMVTLVIVITLSVVLTFLVSSSLINPLREVEQIAESLATLNFDISISHLRQDEIGAMQLALLKIRDNLHNTIDTLHTHLSKMTDTGKTLTGIVHRSSEALEVITGSMNAMQTKADSQSQSVEQTAVSVTDIITRIDSLNQAVQTQKNHITQSSTSIEEMVTHIASIRSVATHAGESTTVLTESSETGRKLLAQLTHEVELIQNRSASLQNANHTIANIAAQTNILAMNSYRSRSRRRDGKRVCGSIWRDTQVSRACRQGV